MEKFKEYEEDGLTVGQFLYSIQGKDLPDEEKKSLALQNLQGPAQKWATDNVRDNMSWSDVKSGLIDNFKANLNIRQKVEMRKNLKQTNSESCQDFLNR